MTPRAGDLNPPLRLLCGTGPTNPDPRVLRALGAQVLGQFDPDFTAIMNEVCALTRDAFRTTNQRSLAVSGTGRAGMEAALASLIERGDHVLVANCGRFGDLFAHIAMRYGARVTQVTAEWGEIIDPVTVERTLVRDPAKIVCLVHGETSTGMLQPDLGAFGRICRTHDALLVVDAVVTLGGVPVEVDAWQIDVAFAGTQKCLGCPSGMAPITYNERTEAVLASRRTPPVTNYLDLMQLQRYWSPERLNHHTLPTSMTYGLREALRIVVEEGDERFARHRLAGEALKAGLQAMGLVLYGNPAFRLPHITVVSIPEGVPDDLARLRMLQEFGVEIATSFGPLQGRVWRIGTMGVNASLPTVLVVLAGLEHVLRAFGVKTPRGVEVAQEIYQASIPAS